jgi:hypothetical protein
MVVAAAGNQPNCNSWGTYYLCSPAKAWNVISVGAYDNANSPNWSDDTMADFSCYVNPSVDREKPEVVAPGVQIVGIGMDGNLISRDGTSFAAPQVAGLAALLIERQTDLRGWPEASRAIIMASAVHNIEGPSGIPSGQELKDGAGGIDAALADLTAKTRWTSATSPCTGPCWWGISINNTNFPVGTYLYRYFSASQGEHIRAAISWWANADCPSENNCSYDRLDTDLQFGVIDPDGQWVPGAWSASWDNNYELVDFTAPKTGKYKLAVYKERADEDSNYLGLAWVKDATYLPDVRGNYEGWTSRFRIRNDGTQPRAFVVTFYNGTVSIPIPTPPVLNPNQVWSFNAATYVGSNFVGSAIVDGGEDASVVVKTTGSEEVTGYGGFQPGSGLGYAATGSTLYAPYIYKHYYHWHTFLRVQNTGGTSTDVTVA